jgi:hypothetical protein
MKRTKKTGSVKELVSKPVHKILTGSELNYNRFSFWEPNHKFGPIWFGLNTKSVLYSDLEDNKIFTAETGGCCD